MSNPVKWIVGVVLAALLFVGGYAFGSRKAGSLEEEVDALRMKAQDADTVRKNSQAEIAKALKGQADENAKQLEAVKADAERSRKELADALAAANDRNAQLEKQRKAGARRTAKGAAPATDLARCNAALTAARLDANACLALAVPKPLVVPLIK